MTAWRAFWETVHLSALGLWSGVLVGVGTCVGVLFPAMKKAGVQLPEYAGDPAGHYRIAAGKAAQQVFLVGDMLMFGLAVAATAALGVTIAVYRVSAVRAATLVRAAALSVALASLGALLFVVTPGINAASRAHWAAAKIGDSAAIAEHVKAVDDLHPIATALMFAELAGVLIALVAGAWSLARPDAGRAATKVGNGHPEPALLKSRRGLGA